MKKKVLIISHAYVEEANLKKIECLSRFSDLEVGVLSPDSWRTWHGESKVKSNSLSSRGRQQTDVAISTRLPRSVGKQGTAILGYTSLAMTDTCTGSSQSIFQSFSLPTYFSGDSGLYFYHPFKFLKLLRDFNPDIVHLEEEPWTPVALETSYFVKKLNKKLIIFSWENIDLYLNFWRNFIESYVFNRASQLIAGNTGAVDRLRKHGFKNKIEILPQFGVDTERFFPPTILESIKEDPSRRKILLNVGFVGRLSADKGLETLFRAFAKINDPNVQLILLSSSSDFPDYFKALSDSLGIRERIKMILNAPHRDFPDYVRSFDLQVLPSLTSPSWKEQFGRVLIEGMACGVPVIGSSSGAIPEVIGEAGLIFREGDVDDLKEKMNLLIKDKSLRERLGQAGQDRVKKLYSYSAIAERTREIYLSLG